MSGNKKTKPDAKRHGDEGRTAEDVRAEKAAGVLRQRREAARGQAPIDRDIHFSLPLTRVFVPLLALTVLGYALSRLGGYLGNHLMENIASIATALLFVSAFIVWFASRHQAKKLTREMRERDDEADSK